jgi:hypothetical protein
VKKVEKEVVNEGEKEVEKEVVKEVVNEGGIEVEEKVEKEVHKCFAPT